MCVGAGCVCHVLVCARGWGQGGDGGGGGGGRGWGRRLWWCWCGGGRRLSARSDRADVLPCGDHMRLMEFCDAEWRVGPRLAILLYSYTILLHYTVRTATGKTVILLYYTVTLYCSDRDEHKERQQCIRPDRLPARHTKPKAKLRWTPCRRSCGGMEGRRVYYSSI